MTGPFDVALLIAASVLLVAVAAVRLSTKLGLPSLLVYLALGMVLGEAGLGIQFADAELARTLGIAALVVIIAEGGLTARWSTLRPVLGLATVLATVGVAISIAVVAAVAHYGLGIEWQLALLYGAVLSPTDAAAVFSTLRRLRLRPRLVAALEAESGLNDAPVVLLVVLVSTGALWDRPPVVQVLVIGFELVAGAAIGAVVAFAGAWLLRRAALPASGLYPLAVIGLTVLAYAAGTVLGASGFLAVYVAGVILGNSRLPHRRAVLGFADGLAWTSQIGLFVLLGLLVSPGRLGAALLPALAIGLTLVLVARPVSVAGSALLPGTGPLPGWRDQAFLSWAGLRGAVPIVLATIPLSTELPGGRELFDVVFVLVVLFTVLQGTTLPWSARRLGVTAPAEPSELRVESAPLDDAGADLLHLEVPDGSRLIGAYVDDLRLPPGAVVTLVAREGTRFVPSAYTRLRAGDGLLIVATPDCRDEAERRLRAVSLHGRLARWSRRTKYSD
ncbi:MAG: potassium/proton antiporter [Micromonosporaceae bacterium]